MRKLKLQMQTTLDGFVAGRGGELDWMTFEEDDEPFALINSLVDSSDTLLMGRKMTDEFVGYWTNLVENQPENSWYEFARKMVDIPKIVFTKTLDESTWANTVLAKGDLVEEVTRLKNQPGKDILVYGGANFVRSLIKENLIDEYNLFVNPVAIGNGLTIFGDVNQKLNLKLVEARAFKNEVVLRYQPNRGE